MNLVCDRCELGRLALERGEPIGILGEGDGSEIVLVGEAPGRHEVQEHRHFVGPAGELLRQYLRKAGKDPSEVYITNAVKCRPPDNRRPKPEEIEACRYYLEIEISTLSPRKILALGSSSLEAMTGRKKVADVRGIEMEYLGKPLFATYHPAAVLREPRLGPMLLTDLRNLFSDESRIRTEYWVISEISQLLLLRDILLNCERFAFDIETSNYDFTTGEILCISFSWDEGKAAGLPINHPDFDWEVEFADVRHYINEILGSDVPKIGHNFKFDAKFLLRNGFALDALDFDTMLASHLLKEESMHSLDSLAPLVGGSKVDLLRYLNNMQESFSKVPWQPLTEYCNTDTDITFRLYKKFSRELKEQKLEDLFYDQVMPLTRSLIDIEMRGVYVDRSYLTTKSKEIQREINLHKSQLKEQLGDINLNSSRQLGKALFEDLGLPVIRRTKSGAPSTDAETLEALAQKHPIPAEILELRKKEKLLNTFLDPGDGKGISRYLNHSSRVYTDYLVHGTVTGRLSSREPNLQNIPRSGGVREIFCVPPGFKFMEADYSQIELRVAAILSDDKVLLNLFELGLDVHDMTAKEIFRKEKISEEERFITKMVEFGLIYGRGAVSIASQLGLPVRKAEEFVSRFFAKYKQLGKWRSEVGVNATKTLEQTNVFGRKRRYSQFESPQEVERQAVNFPIQSTAADITSRAVIRIHKRLEKFASGIIMILHDAIMLEVKDEELEEVSRIVREEMERPIPELKNYSIPVDISISDRWKSKS